MRNKFIKNYSFVFFTGVLAALTMFFSRPASAAVTLYSQIGSVELGGSLCGGEYASSNTLPPGFNASTNNFVTAGLAGPGVIAAPIAVSGQTTVSQSMPVSSVQQVGVNVPAGFNTGENLSSVTFVATDRYTGAPLGTVIVPASSCSTNSGVTTCNSAIPGLPSGGDIIISSHLDYQRVSTPACGNSIYCPTSANVCRYGSCQNVTLDNTGFNGTNAETCPVIGTCSSNAECETQVDISALPSSQSVSPGGSVTYAVSTSVAGVPTPLNFTFNCPAGLECRVDAGAGTSGLYATMRYSDSDDDGNWEGPADANTGGGLSAAYSSYSTTDWRSGTINFSMYQAEPLTLLVRTTGGTSPNTYPITINAKSPDGYRSGSWYTSPTCGGTCSDNASVDLVVQNPPCESLITTAPTWNGTCQNITETGYLIRWNPAGPNGTFSSQVTRVSTLLSSVLNGSCATVGQPGYNPNCTNVTLATTTATITGLQPSTTYYNRVAVVCQNPDLSIGIKDTGVMTCTTQGQTTCTPGTTRSCGGSSGACLGVETCTAGGIWPGTCSYTTSGSYTTTNGTVCDDNNACTSNSTCNNGVCGGAVVSGTHLACVSNSCQAIPNTEYACVNTCTTNLDCNNSSSGIDLAPNTISRTTNGQTVAPSETLTVTNTGTAPLSWKVDSDQSYCMLVDGPTSSTIGFNLIHSDVDLAPGDSTTLTLFFDTGGIDPGTNVCNITATDRNNAAVNDVTVVTYEFTPPSPTYTATDKLIFTASRNGSLPVAQNVTIANTTASGGLALNFSITESIAWLDNPNPGSVVGVSPGSSQNVSIRPNTTNLTAGTYNGTVSISETALGAGNKSVQIIYTITDPAVNMGAVTATANACPAQSVHLAWPSATGGNGGPYTYNVYRKATTDASPGTPPSTPLSAGIGISGNSFDDTTAVFGTLYNYWVEAEGGGVSSKVAANTNGAGIGPSNCVSAPTVTLTANPTTVTQGQASLLTWTVSGADSCSSTGTDSLPAGSWQSSPPTGDSELTAALNTVKTYSFTLRCTNAGGNSEATATVTVNPLPPPPPGNPGGGGSTACSQINLTWDDVTGENNYYIYRNSSNNFSGATKLSPDNNQNDTNFTDFSPSISGNYYWVSSYATVGGESAPVAFDGNSSGGYGSTSCNADINGNKDITKVNGTSPSGYLPDTSMNNETPGNVVYNKFDIVTFSVNLPNQAPAGGESANNVIITDTLLNLRKPSAGWNMKIGATNLSLRSLTPAQCTDYQTARAALSNNEYGECGTSPNQTLYIKVGNIAQAASTSITYNAEIYTTSTQSSSRFKNSIETNYTSSVSGANLKSLASTPLIVFNVSNVPSIIETAP